MTKKFISSFIISFVILFTLLVFFISYINPKQTIPLFSNNQFTTFHQNMPLRKAELMKASPSFDLLLLGSSTSEAYLPVDINKVFNANSFSASIGGANSFDRKVFFKHALVSFPKLKQVVYIADFFEFSQNEAVAEIRLNPYLGKYLKNHSIVSKIFQRLRYILSHNSFEASISVLRKSKKPKKKFLNPDGTTTRSMITAPLAENEKSLLKENSRGYVRLQKEIQDNLYFYRNYLLRPFESLSQDVLENFKALNIESKKKGIKVIYILSPYNINFKSKLLSDKNLNERYNEWKNVFFDFSKEKHITVYDPSLDEMSLDPQSSYWRDGLHYNRQGAYRIINQVSLIK